MSAQHRGFAAAARGNVDDLSVWQAEADRPDPVADYVQSAGAIIDALADVDLDRQSFWLPEIRDGGPFPASMAIAFHLLDYVVHGWDVAVTIAASASYRDEVLHAATAIARLVPDNEERDQPSTAFAHALPSDGENSPLDQTLLLLGRDPAWTPQLTP